MNPLGLFLCTSTPRIWSMFRACRPFWSPWLKGPVPPRSFGELREGPFLPGARVAPRPVGRRAANSRGPGGPTGPLRTPSMTPWILSRRDSAIRNAPALVPGPLARLQDLMLLTELSPQVGRGRRAVRLTRNRARRGARRLAWRHVGRSLTSVGLRVSPRRTANHPRTVSHHLFYLYFGSSP